MEHIGKITEGDKKKYHRKPRYTVVLHDVREKLDLSLNAYVVIDSIHKLSNSNPNYPYCTMSKPKIAQFLKIGEATVFRAIEEAIQKGLVERTPEAFLTTTFKWVELVETYDIKDHN